MAISRRASPVLAVLASISGSCDHQGPEDRSATVKLDGAQWRYEQTSWALQAVDGSRLSIVAALGGDHDCERFGKVDVTEGDDQVELRAFALVRIAETDEELICEASAVLEPVVIVLTSPLGERSLSGCVTTRPIDSVVTRSDCNDIQEQV